MESTSHLSFGGLPTECYTAGLPAGFWAQHAIWKSKGLNCSIHMIKLVQSTMVPGRWSLEQKTAHMQHRHLVILLMALESHGVELLSSFGGLPTECSIAGLPAGLSSATCNENQKVSKKLQYWNEKRESPVLLYWVLRPAGDLLREET